jgi:ethanolaminephosphotransferase
VHLIMAAIACSVNIGSGWRAVAGNMAVMVPFLLAHWEEYHTGVMLYGNSYYGVTEANYTLVLVHFASAVLGPQMWRRRVRCLHWCSGAQGGRNLNLGWPEPEFGVGGI